MNYSVRITSYREVASICSKIPALFGTYKISSRLLKGTDYYILEYDKYKILFSLRKAGAGIEGHIAILPEHRKVARQLTQLVCEWVFTEYDPKAKFIYTVFEEDTKFGKMLGNFAIKCGFVKYNEVYLIPNRRLSWDLV